MSEGWELGMVHYTHASYRLGVNGKGCTHTALGRMIMRDKGGADTSCLPACGHMDAGCWLDE